MWSCNLHSNWFRKNPSSRLYSRLNILRSHPSNHFHIPNYNPTKFWMP